MKQMKLFLISILLMTCTMMQAQDRQFESCPLTVVNEGWKAKTIDNVINGSLGIMLERFDQTWPTWMVGEVRDAMEKGLSKVVLDEETDLTVTVDSKNGYVSVGDAGTDGECRQSLVCGNGMEHGGVHDFQEQHVPEYTDITAVHFCGGC